jgi:hypothetical protein
LLITGSGILTAEGTGANNILFTKAPEISHWGHISFETPGTGTPITGTGTFAYCVVENGYAATSGTNPSNAGGGIQVNANGVVISHCIIRNNYSNFGGGITVNAGRNTIIRNTLFSSNSSNEAGGGLLLWTNSTALVENCVFENNLARGTSSSLYGGGGIWLLSNTSRIVNCTFSNNTSPRAGDGIYSYNSANARIINSILWGSSDQFGGSVNTSTIVTCAFETTKPVQAANSIVIDPVNDALNGPHFIDPANSGWAITYPSPCRNTGTDTYAGVTIPSADYAGNPRIGVKDIGAYEVQYSNWIGAVSDSWTNASNWESSVAPVSGNSDVIITTGLSTYPVSTLNPDFVIGAGHQMILEPGARATLSELTNNGTLRMRASAAGLSSLIMSSYTRGSAAVEDIQIFLTGGYIGDPENFEGRWHYISSPVNGTPVDIFTGNTWDLARWVDGIQGAGSMRQGWVAYDGWAYLIDDDPNAPPSTWFGYPYRFNSMTLGQGYNYFFDESESYSLSGQLNTGSVQVNLEFAGQTYENGFNLVGNPFTSGLDWDYITDNTVFPANTSRSIQFTRDNEVYYYVAGVMTPDPGFPPTGVIPPMQGFFVKTYQDNVILNLSAEARTHDNIPPRYKGGMADIPLVRLAVTDNGSSDETVIRFAETAKTGNDLEYDALKMFIPDNKTTIYTISEGLKYAVNGQPYPGEDTILEIPVTIGVYSDGNHMINVKALQGLDEYRVTLTDLQTAFTADLKTTSEISFSAPSGLISDRFVLKVSTLNTGIEDPLQSGYDFNIFHGFGMINIRNLNDKWNGLSATVTITDLTGKRVQQRSEVMSGMNSIIQVPAPSVKGMYLVKINSGSKKFVGKLVVR